MMPEEKYQTACVKEPKKVLEFLIKHLDFFDSRQEKKRYVGKLGVTVSNKLGNNYLQLLNFSLIANKPNSHEIIILNTDDCLRDYHKLKSADIKIEQIPRYTARGLEAIISDNYGNHFMLLEKRNYSEM